MAQRQGIYKYTSLQHGGATINGSVAVPSEVDEGAHYVQQDHLS